MEKYCINIHAKKREDIYLVYKYAVEKVRYWSSVLVK